MVLFDTYRIPLAAAISFIIIFTASCGGSVSTVPDQPSDSITFDSLNAIAVANIVLISRQNLSLATRGWSGHPLISLCNSGGSISTVVNGTTTVKNGTITFSDCNNNNQIIINGLVTFHLRIINVNNETRFNGFGTLLFTNPTQSTSFSLDMDFNEIYQTDSGNFKRTDNFAVFDYPGLSDFLVETTKLFEGNYFTDLLDTGKMLIYGDNNTLILISVNKNSASVKFDDGSGSGFKEVAGSPIFISP